MGLQGLAAARAAEAIGALAVGAGAAGAAGGDRGILRAGGRWLRHRFLLAAGSFYLPAALSLLTLSVPHMALLCAHLGHEF
jgi:hypothetical protein